MHPMVQVVQPSGIVTLLTDFGLEDVYVGVMKGVMLNINPRMTLVDLTHQIPSQNVELGAFQLQNAYPHFPVGTVHLAVVDPGVGSARRAIAIATPSGFFVGPDNGIFSPVLEGEGWIQASALDNPQYWYSPTPSATFHGRDIFSAAAAHLASGVPFKALGTALAAGQLTVLPKLPCTASAIGLQGVIRALDRFGNGISNIPAMAVQGREWAVTVEKRLFPHHATYSEVEMGHPVSLVGSHGWVELAVRGGSAQKDYGLALGDRVELTWV